MAKCMSCGKSVLLTSSFGNVVLCRNCDSFINVSEWRNRDFSSIQELERKKNDVLQKAFEGNLSQSVMTEIAQYFNEYINAGFITSIDGKAGQTIKVFSNHCIITTKNDGKKTELENMFHQFDETDDDDDGSILTSEDKLNLAKGLLSGRIVQAGIGTAVSATLNKQEKEKIAERKAHERQKSIARLISVGERHIDLHSISSVDTFSRANTANGYLKLVHSGADQNTLYDCEYFFFNNSIPFKSRKIKQEIEIIKNILSERIVTLKQEELMAAVQAKQPNAEQQYAQPSKVDTFEEIRKFKQLFDEGIITEDEFNKKKKELLNL